MQLKLKLTDHRKILCAVCADRKMRQLRHDGVAKALHWDLCGQYEFERNDKWYEHSPENVEDNEKCKLLWDFSIQTDRKLDHNRPDIVLVDKQSKSCLIIDVACPNDWRVESKQEEKVNKYLDLAFQIKKLWKMKRVKVVPIVIGALGTVPKKPEEHLTDINVGIELAALQKTVLLGSARILRRVLEI